MFEFDDAASPETSGEYGVTSSSSSSPSSPPSCRCYTEAPIQMLVLFHKAMRAELTELLRGVLEVLERSEEDSLIDVAERDFVTSVYKRFEFVEIAYKYHCAAEDEVIFFALDAHVSHVANTYSLEHKSIDGLFKSVSHCLDILMEVGEYFYSPLQELVSCISTLQAAVCKHMMKEEKQVFPLLMKQFSSTEQASLVWRFLCNVPITLLMDLLPWMTSFLSKEEQVDLLRCMREVIPKEKLLQEVVFSWLGKNSCPLVGTSTRTREGAQCFDGLHKSNTFSEEHPVNNFSEIRKITCFLQTNTMLSPIDSVSVWHGAIQKDLKENLEDLYQIRSSKNHNDLASVVVQLKFIADVLTFYSNALDKIVYPVLKEVGNYQLSFSSGRFFNESQIEGLQKSLYCNSTNEMSLCNFVDRLYREVDSFIKLITKQFAFHEREVFPLISKNCDQSTQQQLMYAGLQTMPLGMLKCVTTWFSAHLSERQSMCILGSLKDGCTTMNKPFASLLLEWIRTGYSGKTSIENFRKDLRSMFETKCFSLLNHIKKDTVSSSVLLNVQRCNGPSHSSVESISSDKVSRIEPQSSSSSQISEKRATLYSSGINMQIFFPGTLEIVYPATKYHIEETNGETNAHLDPAPIDHILFFSQGSQERFRVPCLWFNSIG